MIFSSITMQNYSEYFEWNGKSHDSESGGKNYIVLPIFCGFVFRLFKKKWNFRSYNFVCLCNGFFAYDVFSSFISLHFFMKFHIGRTMTFFCGICFSRVCLQTKITTFYSIFQHSRWVIYEEAFGAFISDRYLLTLISIYIMMNCASFDFIISKCVRCVFRLYLAVEFYFFINN